MIKLKDNSQVPDKYKNDELINSLADRTLDNLSEENFLIFPSIVGDSADLKQNTYLFKKNNNKMYTSNLVGIVKKETNEIRITSRFYNTNTEEDFLTRYLLQKVLNINVVDSDASLDINLQYYDLLVYLFPYYFNLAMQKGLYKEYQTKYHNNSNLKGKIMINHHIKQNTPFNGKISYSTREFSFDNDLTHLIRHTYEKIKNEHNIQSFYDNDFEENSRILVNITKNYSKYELERTLKSNISNRVRHGFFEEYYFLQDICIRILSEDKVGFGKEDNKVHGIIIDISWLWEEYLARILSNTLFVHSDNRAKTNPIYIYEGDKRPRYPDFYTDKIILDAKYKFIEKNKNSGILREDLHQIISYLHISGGKLAGVVFPSQNETGYKELGDLNGYGGKIFKLGFKIPDELKNLTYNEFTEEMKSSELELIKELNRLIDYF